MSSFVPSFLDDSLSGPLWRMLTAPAIPLAPAQRPLRDGQQIEVADTLCFPTDATADERPVLEHIAWRPEKFEVDCRAQEGGGDLTLSFPSPLPLGHPVWDVALLDWHIARAHDGQPIEAPAMLVLDILRGGNRVSGFIAKLLASAGVHGFVLHLPQNGRRTVSGEPHDWTQFLPTLRQNAADARRARDVIAALPLVRGNIGIQGTSLGGFVATLAASIDGAFDPVILAITGGDLADVLRYGQADAARVRDRLHTAGYSDASLRDWLWNVEPLRVAHRLNRHRTWLFTARNDQVIPPPCSQKLADAIGLDAQHHRWLAGNRYTAVMGAGKFLGEMLGAIRS
jgi:dienelactone hydrolase